MYSIKIIETNNKIEIWKYSLPIHSDYSMNDFEKNNKERRNQSEMTNSEKMEAFQRKGKYYREKRHDIRRLIEMNYNAGYTKFVTLTFSEHITDVESANYEFKKFIERLKYRLKRSVKYLAVLFTLVESGKKTLDIRYWTCECGAEHDRDVNASKNIKNEGLR